jgi:transcriptional regulator CtsR
MAWLYCRDFDRFNIISSQQNIVCTRVYTMQLMHKTQKKRGESSVYRTVIVKSNCPKFSDNHQVIGKIFDTDPLGLTFFSAIAWCATEALNAIAW